MRSSAHLEFHNELSVLYNLLHDVGDNALESGRMKEGFCVVDVTVVVVATEVPVVN